LEQEVAEKQAEVEDLQKSKADPKRIAASPKSFGDIFEGVEAGDKQVLVGLMAKRITIAPTRIESELYDHSPIIEDWSKGQRDGWFRTRLSWLSTPMSSGTTICVGVDVDVWGFEGGLEASWGELLDMACFAPQFALSRVIADCTRHVCSLDTGETVDLRWAA